MPRTSAPGTGSSPAGGSFNSRAQAGRRRVRAFTRLLDRAPSVVVATLAAWSLAYWVGLAASWPVLAVGLLALLELAAVGLVLVLGRRRAKEQARGDEARARAGAARPLPWPVVLSSVAGAALALGLGLSGRRTAAGVLAALGVLALLGWGRWASPEHTGLTSEVSTSDASTGERVGGTGRISRVAMARAEALWAAVVSLSAVAMAVLSTQVAHPDGDDAYFVNFATYVAERGRIPTRDTILSDQAFPAMASHDPPLESWEALVGLIARVLHLDAAHASYALVLPLMVMAFVLALAQLVRVCRVPLAPWGMLTALVLVVLDGSTPAAFGYLSFTRLWVGKIVLVAVVLPVFVSFVIRYLRRGRRSDLSMVLASSTAAVGVSSSGVFIVPLLASAAVLAGLAVRRYRRAAWLALAAVPPLVCGAATAMLAPAPLTTPTEPLGAGLGVPVGDVAISGDDVLGMFALDGGHLVVFAMALVLGLLALRSRTARAAVGSCLLVFAVLVSTPVLHLLLRAVPSLDAVMWRMWFLVPVPLLYAALPAGAAAVVGSLLALRAAPAVPPRRLHAVRLLAAAAAAGLAVAVFAANGPSAVSRGAGTYPGDWHALKALPGAEQGVRYLDRQARPGDVVLAPDKAARLGPLITTRWHSVAPRLDYLRTGFNRSIPELHAVQRLELQAWLVGRRSIPDVELDRTLDLVGVDLVCLEHRQRGKIAVLKRIGWRVSDRGFYTCLREG